MFDQAGVSRVSRFEVPDLGIGVGYRVPHYDRIVEERPKIDWLEVLSENFMVAGGSPRHFFDRVTALYPCVPHGVSMSLGSDPDAGYVERLRELVDAIAPPWVSDHVCFTGTPRARVHDLLPLPYTEEVLSFMVDRAKETQDRLGCLLAVENPSSYLTYRDSSMPEWVFLAELVERADCAVMLDVNNVFVSSVNHGFSPREYLDFVPSDRVVQIHLAGHSIRDGYRLDTHDHPVCDEVWDLYRYAIARMGPISTLVEWDDNIPSLERLLQEAQTARCHRDAALAERVRPLWPQRPAPLEVVPVLPNDWRDRMVAMITGHAEADDAWFSGGPGLTAMQQLEVYQEQYRLRLYGALKVEVGGLVHFLGDRAYPVLMGFLHDHRSTSWTLNRVADGLVDWLREQGEPTQVVELAALDGLVQAGFEAAEGTEVDPGSLVTMPALRLQPHVGLLRATSTVHRYRSTVLKGDEPMPLEQGDFPIVVFRRGIKMRHMVVHPWAFAILEGLKADRSVSDVVTGLVATGAPISELGTKLAGFFRLFGETRLVEVATASSRDS